MKKLALVSVLLLAYFSGKSQMPHLHNPSFEGTPQAHIPPTPWESCFNGGSPDTQPGTWGINMPASNGNSYVSFLMSGDSAESYVEGVSQELVTCLTPGQSYTISLDLARSNIYNTAEPANCYSSLGIWGGYSSGHKGQLLWASGIITDTTWQTYITTIIPTDDWCYLSFGPYFIDTCSGYVNVLLDNIGGDFTSIDENKQTIKTGLYPNPAGNTITVTIPAIKNQTASIQLYNAAGQLVKVITNVKQQENTIDITNLVNGLYYYTVITANEFGSGKFAKQ